MSTGQLVALGGVAGFTILLGLPAGRLGRVGPSLQGALAALASGILLFLLWDVLGQGLDPVESALTVAVDGGSWTRFAGLALLLAGTTAIGLMSLVYYDRWLGRRRAGAGPAAASAGRYLALLVATGIGLHNFSEGLAIGQSAAQEQIGLAFTLVVGFGLHNATEGFGIVAPLAGERERPSWGFLALLGLIGGGPTLVGTLVGSSVASDPLAVAFLGLAAGSILYVVIELIGVSRRLAPKTIFTWALLAGVLGFATDLVLEATGA